jgi:hypothetical protein
VSRNEGRRPTSDRQRSYWSATKSMAAGRTSDQRAATAVQQCSGALPAGIGSRERVLDEPGMNRTTLP